VVVIPPMVPHSNASADGFQNIHINMVSPALSIPSPTVISDDSNHFLLDAFNAAFFHFYSARPETSSLLSVYGDLISCYLAAYRTGSSLTPIVAQIENNIISNYADSSYELDSYLHSLPFSYDYLRKLFQKELGVTPHRYLVDKRLKMAAELLLCDASAGVRTIADIAPLCGFHDPLYFSKMFKKKYGTAPRNFLESRFGGAVPVQDSDRMKVRLDEPAAGSSDR
jgi:AraC-type DNA-binding domain-containing proteins